MLGNFTLAPSSGIWRTLRCELEAPFGRAAAPQAGIDSIIEFAARQKRNNIVLPMGEHVEVSDWLIGEVVGILTRNNMKIGTGIS